VGFLSGKFENVKVVESHVVYDKHGRRIVEDILEFTDGLRHEYSLRKASNQKAISIMMK